MSNVRDVFERILDTPEPPMTDTAELLARGESVRRRRRLVTVAATAAVMLLAIAGVGVFLQLRGPAQRHDTAQPTPSTSAGSPTPSPGGTSSVGPARSPSAGPPPASVGPTGRSLDRGRSGLAWASGVFPEKVQSSRYADSFATFRGRAVDVAVVSTDRGDWTKMTTASSYLFEDAYFPRSWGGQLVISQAMWPENQGNLAECAAGGYRSRFTDFGRALVAVGRGSSVVRLGWSFNTGQWYWQGSNADQYRACFRANARALKDAAPQVLVEWSLDASNPTTACGGWAQNCYPGNDVVDVIGVDMYDKAHATTAGAFATVAERPDGLLATLAFAKQNRKRFAVEWAVYNPDRSSQSDNGYFVERMVAFFRANTAWLAYEAYFNSCNAAGSDLSECGQNPRAAARYKELYR